MIKFLSSLYNSKKIYDINNLSKRKVVFFGASKCGTEILERFEAINIKPDYFCDNDEKKWGKQFNSIEVISLDQLVSLGKDVNIVITSLYVKEITVQLRKLGFQNIMSFNDQTTTFIQSYCTEYIFNNIDKIKSVLDILNDDISKETFMAIINHRLTYDFGILNNTVNEEEEYFPDDLLKLNDNEVFIDAGAYIGDTISEFIYKVDNKFKKIYAFEPDKKSYDQMVNFIKTKKIESKVICKEGGLHSENKVIQFDECNTVRSKIDNKGLKSIKVYNLDEFKFDNDDIPTIIKMDIEGSEMDALLGAKKIITQYKPKMAICIYHKADDLWNIPLYIKSLCSDYKIYIRHYSSISLAETICYVTI
ncbi:FkbM family methyltransferase [Clostridium sp. P21]|uniref:FkbM family methyltransferase n=1 Tax=Clostridium muellerianum TaxID=2716538 RepID=A0A7Y0EE71_9CLOT|nr:FkbM family methyltransferase [Clostridium muellerianum]NMM61482.1 FkbM family methyltransferase [Clostridium muellerianum]